MFVCTVLSFLFVWLSWRLNLGFKTFSLQEIQKGLTVKCMRAETSNGVVAKHEG